MKSLIEDVGHVGRREKRWVVAGRMAMRCAEEAWTDSEEVAGTGSTSTAACAATAEGHRYSGAGHAEKVMGQMPVSWTAECDTT